MRINKVSNMSIESSRHRPTVVPAEYIYKENYSEGYPLPVG